MMCTECYKPLLNPHIVFFFFSLSTFASKRTEKEKKKERRCFSFPLHELFISQACHINKGRLLGQGAKRRNKKEKKNCVKPENVSHTKEERGGGAVWMEMVDISASYLTPLNQ